MSSLDTRLERMSRAVGYGRRFTVAVLVVIVVWFGLVPWIATRASDADWPPVWFLAGSIAVVLVFAAALVPAARDLSVTPQLQEDMRMVRQVFRERSVDGSESLLERMAHGEYPCVWSTVQGAVEDG